MPFITPAIVAAMLATGFAPLVTAQAKACPTDGPLSCQNTTAQTDTCCFNAPGGSLLQTQFWDYNPATGPSDSWTIHGLWPDHCDGTYDANCDASRAYTNITQILQTGSSATLSYMQTYWKDYQGNDESFWEHEWSKHGTCISTLKPSCYTNYEPTQEAVDFFERTVALFKNLDSYTFLKDAGIVPDSSKTYSLSAVQSALANGHGGFTPVVQCSNGAINEIWYYFNVGGSVQTGNFVAVGSDGTTSDCPATVSYIPKGTGGAVPTSTKATTGSSPTPTSTGTFSGKGHLNVVSSGKTDGCLISSGKWYTTGTCATFTAAASGSGFTLQGSKGYCGVLSDGSIDCSQTSGTIFTGSGTTLSYQSSTKFYAPAVASGSTQETVYVNSHTQSVTIQWQSA